MIGIGLSTSAMAAPVNLSLGNLSQNEDGDFTLDVLMTNSAAVAGLEFEISGAIISGKSGGDLAGWSGLASNSYGLLAYNSDGDVLAPGEHTLTTLTIAVSQGATEVCIVDAVFSDAAGDEITTASECFSLGLEVSFGSLTVSGMTGSIPVIADSAFYEIAGFQFETNANVTGVGGGVNSNGDWDLAYNSVGVVAVNTEGGALATGENLLTNIVFSGGELDELCLSELVFTDRDGNDISVNDEVCVSIGVTISLVDVDLSTNTVDVQVSAPFASVGGFQFSLTGASVVNASGGASAAWTVSNSGDTVVGFEMEAAVIDPGVYTLTRVRFEPEDPDLCVTDYVFSDGSGDEIDSADGGCVSIYDVSGDAMPASVDCPTDVPPYWGATVSGFQPAMFPGEETPLCSAVAPEGSLITSYTARLVDPSGGLNILLADIVYDEPVAVANPGCGDANPPRALGVGHCNLAENLQISSTLEPGYYVLHYRVITTDGVDSVEEKFNVPFARLNLPLALDRVELAITKYMDATSGVIRSSGIDGADLTAARGDATDTKTLITHVRGAYEQNARSTVYTGVCDLHTSIKDLRDSFRDSDHDHYNSEVGDEVEILMEELYRSLYLHAEEEVVLVGPDSIDATVNARFDEAKTALDTVDTESSANPAEDLSWAIGRHLLLDKSITGSIETKIAADLVPRSSDAVTLIRLIADGADELLTAIEDADGAMLGEDEMTEVYDLAIDLEDRVDYIVTITSNKQAGQFIYDLFELQVMINDAREDASLGTDEMAYWCIELIYVVVENLMPNALQNVAAHELHPWYMENAARWDYMGEALRDYQLNSFDITYTEKFIQAALGEEALWLLLVDYTSSYLDPDREVGSANTRCGVLQFTNHAYYYDACYYAMEPFDVDAACADPEDPDFEYDEGYIEDVEAGDDPDNLLCESS